MFFQEIEVIHKHHGSINLLCDEHGFIFYSKKDVMELIKELERSYALISDYDLKQIEDENILLSEPAMYFQCRENLPAGYTMSDYREILSKSKRITTRKENKRLKNSIGVVYFLYGNGFIKIGKSSNFKYRKSWFDVKLPFKVELVHTIKSNDIHACEIIFHKRYEDKRANGEWFNLTAEDVAEIKLVERMDF